PISLHDALPILRLAALPREAEDRGSGVGGDGVHVVAGANQAARIVEVRERDLAERERDAVREGAGDLAGGRDADALEVAGRVAILLARDRREIGRAHV